MTCNVTPDPAGVEHLRLNGAAPLSLVPWCRGEDGWRHEDGSPLEHEVWAVVFEQGPPLAYAEAKTADEAKAALAEVIRAVEAGDEPFPDQAATLRM